MSLVDTRKSVQVVTSRFRGLPILRDDQGRERFATYRFVPVPFLPADQYHQVTAADAYRLDLISYKYFSTPEFDWYIAEANQLPDKVESVVPGVVLRIPDINWVFSQRQFSGD